MNYEDFSVEARAGIEQFRKYMMIDNKIKNPAMEDIMVIAACVLFGSSYEEALKVATFAKSKNYWVK